MKTPHLSGTGATLKIFCALALTLCLFPLSTQHSRGQSIPQPSVYLPLIMTEIQPAGPNEWDPRLVARGLALSWSILHQSRAIGVSLARIGSIRSNHKVVIISS